MAYNVTIGDVFEVDESVARDCGNFSDYGGKYIRVSSLDDGGDIRAYEIIKSDGRQLVASCKVCFKIAKQGNKLKKVSTKINSSGNLIKKMNNFFKKLTDSKVQELSKAGYLNGDLQPTQKAYDTVNEIAFFANYEALVALATAENVEAEAKSKK